jgi:hypothetical protein
VRTPQLIKYLEHGIASVNRNVAAGKVCRNISPYPAAANPAQHFRNQNPVISNGVWG